MAHELEQLAGGQTAFVTARQPAWHQLGEVTDRCLTAAEIMAKAFLGGWRVRKITLHGEEITPNGVTRIDCPDKWMTVRTHVETGETQYLGVVGEDYTPVQNEEVAEMLDKLVDAAGGAHFETAGSLRGGRRVFVTMKLPQGMSIAGVDDMDLYLAATTSHDGTAALRVDATPVRIVCANTDRAALAATKGYYVFRHTSNVHSQIAQAREAMGLMWDYFTAFEQAAEKMINSTLTMGGFENVIDQLWPLPVDASEATQRNHKQRTATLRYLLRDADTQAAIRGTRWAGYQAVTEYVDHFAPAKTIDLRAARAVAGTGADLKARAFELLTV
jgi:phage/plasmid-like protein (TIGR03299 family)